MYKRNGTYYLMYSDAMCQDSSYNVKYSTSKSPTGPFDYNPAQNPILETTDDGTVDGPGHHSMLVEGDKVYIVYHRHDNPHDTDGAHRQTCISELYFNGDGSIEKVQPGHAGVGYLAPSTKRDTNLALGKPATASSFLSSDSRPEYGVDQNNGTLWKAGDSLETEWTKETVNPEDGLTYRRWSHTRYDSDTRLEHTIDRYEVLREDKVIASEEHVQSPATLSYTQDQAVALYQAAGFSNIQVYHEFTFDPVRPDDTTFCVLGFKPE